MRFSTAAMFCLLTMPIFANASSTPFWLRMQEPCKAAIFSNDTYQPLASVTNDRNPNVDRLYVAISPQGAVDGVRFIADHSNCPADFSDAQMSSADGANIEQDSHRPIVLYANFIGTSDRAAFRVDYLSNGLFGSYHTCNAAAVRDPQGMWHMINTYTNTPVDHLFIKTWSLGISTIEGICPTDN